MPELSAIAFTKFNGAVLKGKKEDHVKGLLALMADQPTVLNLDGDGVVNKGDGDGDRSPLQH